MISVQTERIIGQYHTNQKGKLFLATSSIHGNEPAGTLALQRVFAHLQAHKPAFNGMFVGLLGNVRAYERSQRFNTIDLNRQWQQSKIDVIMQTPSYQLSNPEEKEQKELLQLIHTIKENFTTRYSEEAIFMLDLHTFSTNNDNAYCITLEVGASKSFATKLGVPVIVGLENTLTGTTIQYFATQDMMTCCFEAGQHIDPRSIEKSEAAIWLLLHHLGCLDKQDIPNFSTHYNLLQEVGQSLPSIVKFCHRHAIKEDDNFVMKRGYTNFQPVKKGEVLAQDKNGNIISPADGLMLMPLYQKKGEDGFFIVQESK